MSNESGKNGFNPVRSALEAAREAMTATPADCRLFGPVLQQIDEALKVVSEKPRGGRNFMKDLLKKTVICETYGELEIPGVLEEYNLYEIKLDTPAGKVILFKHALTSIKEPIAKVRA